MGTCLVAQLHADDRVRGSVVGVPQGHMVHDTAQHICLSVAQVGVAPVERVFPFGAEHVEVRLAIG